MCMTPRLIMGCLLVVACCSAQDDVPSIRRIELQLRELHAELLESRVEIQASKVAWLEQQASFALAETQRLRALEESYQAEIRQVERALSATELASDERLELEQQRSDVIRVRLTHAHAAAEEANRRLSALGSQLQAESQKLHALRARVSAMN